MTIAIIILFLLAFISLILSKYMSKYDRGQVMPVNGLLWICVAIGFGAVGVILILIKLLFGL